MSETTVIANLRERVAELERAVAFFERHLGVTFVDEDKGGCRQTCSSSCARATRSPPSSDTSSSPA